jgi:hypothetical protein
MLNKFLLECTFLHLSTTPVIAGYHLPVVSHHGNKKGSSAGTLVLACPSTALLKSKRGICFEYFSMYRPPRCSFAEAVAK